MFDTLLWLVGCQVHKRSRLMMKATGLSAADLAWLLAKRLTAQWRQLVSGRAECGWPGEALHFWAVFLLWLWRSAVVESAGLRYFCQAFATFSFAFLSSLGFGIFYGLVKRCVLGRFSVLATVACHSGTGWFAVFLPSLHQRGRATQHTRKRSSKASSSKNGLLSNQILANGSPNKKSKQQG